MTPRRIPVVSTIVVLAAVALMIGLGIWQIQRLHEKEALLAQYGVNAGLPAIAVQDLQPITDESLFRRVTVECPEVVGWRIAGGRTASGGTGWRHIAICRLKEFGPGLAIDMGTADTTVPPAWKGGAVSGRLTWMPSNQPLVMRMIGMGAAPRPMVVSDSAAPGLTPTPPPDAASVPNNHLAYAVQWFLFAGVALIIYGIALRRRARSVAPKPPRG